MQVAVLQAPHDPPVELRPAGAHRIANLGQVLLLAVLFLLCLLVFLPPLLVPHHQVLGESPEAVRELEARLPTAGGDRPLLGVGGASGKVQGGGAAGGRRQAGPPPTGQPQAPG